MTIKNEERKLKRNCVKRITWVVLVLLSWASMWGCCAGSNDDKEGKLHVKKEHVTLTETEKKEIVNAVKAHIIPGRTALRSDIIWNVEKNNGEINTIPENDGYIVTADVPGKSIPAKWIVFTEIIPVEGELHPPDKTEVMGLEGSGQGWCASDCPFYRLSYDISTLKEADKSLSIEERKGIYKELTYEDSTGGSYSRYEGFYEGWDEPPIPRDKLVSDEELMARYGITPEQMEAIDKEGMDKGWFW